jgi:hypothetical protein
MSNQKVAIAKVNINLDADAAGAKGLEKWNTLQIIVMRMDGNGKRVLDKGLTIGVPYRGTIPINVLAKSYVVRIIGDTYRPRSEALNPKKLNNTSGSNNVSD